MLKKVGTFLTKSRVIRISDPCYDKKVWCCGTVQNCRIGKWSAFVVESDEGDWGTRIAELVAVHGDVSTPEAQIILDRTDWKDSNIDVGVDSGQCGIFDDSEYPEGETGEYDGKGSFYDQCCNKTLSKNRSGVVNFGVVSSSGFGDGSYQCLVSTGESVVAIKIIYIDNDREEDLEDE